MNAPEMSPSFSPAPTKSAPAIALAGLLLASGSAFAGTYLNECLSRHKDPATGRTICSRAALGPKPTKCCKISDSGAIDLTDCGGVVGTEHGYWCVKGQDYFGVRCRPAPDGSAEVCETPKGNPTKCCKIDDGGNIDYDDCGGVVITESGYWCVKGNDYVGVYCEANPDGNSEVCTNRSPPQDVLYSPDCEHDVTSASGLRVCIDEDEPGLPQGVYCCGKVENGQVDESTCSPVTAKPDPSTGVTEFTCAQTLLACAPESSLLTWCTPV